MIKNLETQLSESQNLLLTSKDENEILINKLSSISTNTANDENAGNTTTNNEDDIKNQTSLLLETMTEKYNDSCTTVADLMGSVTSLETELQEAQTLLVQKQEQFDVELGNKQVEIQKLNQQITQHTTFLKTHETLHKNTINKHDEKLSTMENEYMNQLKR